MIIDVISTINDEIDLKYSVNEIFKEIKSRSMNIFLQLDSENDKYRLSSSSNITESLSDGIIFRKEVISLIDNLNKYLLKLNDKFIIRIFEIILFTYINFSILIIIL